MSKATDFLLGKGLITEDQADEVDDSQEGSAKLLADVMECLALYKADATMTNANIGKEIKKAFDKQITREAAKAERIAARKAARQASK